MVMIVRNGYDRPQWLTFNQGKELGAMVRKGEKGTAVYFWQFNKIRDEETDSVRKVPFVKMFTVFNVAQFDNLNMEALKTLEKPQGATGIEGAERIVSQYTERENLLLAHECTDQPCYIPTRDKVSMPMRETFHSNQDYYSVLFHELTHSTGHEKRLARKFGKTFGNELYAKEELIAEIGSCLVCNELDIQAGAIENNKAYVQNWLSALKKDPSLIITAAGAAEKAARFIVSGEKPQMIQA